MNQGRFQNDASKIIKSFLTTRTKILMAASTASAIVEKKLEYYKKINASKKTDVKPNGWDNAKPFESIPGPKPLPVIGNKWRFMLPKFGDFYGKDFTDVNKILYEQYGEITILKGVRGYPIVFIYNPKDVEMLYRNEGVWPIRKFMPALDKYREVRKEACLNFGLVSHHGEEWFKIRTMVNPILMHPKNILQYTDKMNLVADELIDNMKYFSKQNEKGEMPENFRNELYKWSLESVGVVTLDTHLGCLKRDQKPDSESQEIIQNVTKFFDLMYRLDILPSMYQYFSTPDWREFVRAVDFLTSTNIKHINRALDQIEKEEVDDENETKSVLRQLLKKDRNVAVGMASDMMFAGIDTTGRVLGAGLYYLARNPQKQEQLRKETKTLLPRKNSPITTEVLAQATYLKAVIKEVTRLAPIAIGNLRTTVKDLVLAGYQIPKGTEVLTPNLMLCTKDENFPRGLEFLPERWLSTAPPELSLKNANPFVFAPFGYGPRSCIGKRLANLELEIAFLKIIRNFDLKWPHEDMIFTTTTLYGIGKPLKLHVKSLDE